MHLHTDDGTSRILLRVRSRGRAETIDGRINGGGAHGIDVEAATGTTGCCAYSPNRDRARSASRALIRRTIVL